MDKLGILKFFSLVNGLFKAVSDSRGLSLIKKDFTVFFRVRKMDFKVKLSFGLTRGFYL